MRIVFWLSYWSMCILDRLYFRCRVIGRENIPKNGNAIFASNHISNLDPFIIGYLTKGRCCFMAKEELFRNRYSAWFFRNLDAFPVRRGASDSMALRESLRRLRKGRSLVLFPEGTRGTGEREKRSYPGIGFIAVKSQAMVIPVFLSGTETALPTGSKWFRRHPVIVIFGKAMKFNGKLSYEKIAQDILSVINKLSII